MSPQALEFDNGTGREPLKVEVLVRDPEAGETIREVVTHHPPEGADKTQQVSLMLADATGQAMETLEQVYRDAEVER